MEYCSAIRWNQLFFNSLFEKDRAGAVEAQSKHPKQAPPGGAPS